jgi:hypothetical protein
MIAKLYQDIAPAVPIAALLISVISLIVSLRNRIDQRATVLHGKKTNIITTLAERRAALGHLTLVYAQKLQILQSVFGAKADDAERKRVEGNLALVVEEQNECEKLLEQVRNTSPTDIATLESLQATSNEFLTHVREELEKESGALKELRNLLSG